MAIAIDAVTDLTQTTATSLTYSHTCTGSNRMLIVGVRSTGTCTGVTYNGVSMTQQAFSNGSGGSGINNYIFSLHAPATGANNVVISMSSSIDIASGAMSYTGVNQSSTLDSTLTGVANATSITMNFTTVADNCWLVMVGDNAGSGYTEGTGTTRRYPVAGGNSKFGFDSNGAKTPAGSHSMSLSSGASQGWTLVGVSIAPQTGTAYSMAVTVGAFTLTGYATLFYKALQMTAAVGAFTMTGVNTAFTIARTMAVSVGSFILSGKDAILRASNMLWDTQSKNTTSWTPVNKNSASWGTTNKNSSSWTPQDKN